jgi:hypothetical protein
MAKGSPPDTGAARILLDEPGHLIVHAWKNILVFIWVGDAPAALMRKLGPIVEAHVREVGRVSVVSVVAKISELPDESRRQAYKEFVAAHGAMFAHQVIVIEREGFIGSAVRGFITGLVLLTRQSYTVHVTSSVEDAAAWLPVRHATVTGVAVDPVELTRVVARARSDTLARPTS